MFPLDEIHFFNDLSPARSGEVNMAIDEILLQECRLPWVRVYNWSKETISVGYFSTSNFIQSESKAWVRRWTGGGLVHHGGARDATYALGIPRSNYSIPDRSACLYRDIHQALQRALSLRGIDCDLDDGHSMATSGACFENPVSSDLISCYDGIKIAGGAQRRSRYGLLHQGSIQRVDLPEDFGLTFANSLAGKVQQLRIDVATVERAVTLAEVKYSSSEWRHKY